MSEATFSAEVDTQEVSETNNLDNLAMGDSPTDLNFALGAMDLEFGIPGGYATRAPRKTSEKYPDTPVLTMFAAPTEAKKAFRFELNPKGQELLGFKGKDAETSETIAFSFKVKSHLLLVNLTGQVTDANKKGTINFTKSGSFSDKVSHEYLVKTLAIDNTIDNEFELTPITHNVYKIADLKLLNVPAAAEAGELNIPEESETFKGNNQ